MTLTTRSVSVGPLPPGMRLHWYEIQNVLGQGGFGVTYSGWDTNLKQAVAIKEYLPQDCAARGTDGVVRDCTAGGSGNFVWGLRRFIDEARTLARLRHSSIVRAMSVFEANGTAYMVMELERGLHIDKAISAGRLDTDAALVDFLTPLLDGLAYVHAEGFIHRDVKCDNIVIREDGTPVLLDFGSARRAQAPGRHHLTTVVSRGFAPFEQYDDSGQDLPQGPWTDVYALGATAYYVITGHKPVDALTRGAAILRNRPDPFRPPPPRPGTDFSPAMLDAVCKALAFRPEDRPASAGAWSLMLPRESGSEARRPAERRVVSELVPPDEAPANEVLLFTDESSVDGGRRRLEALSVLVVDDETHALTMTSRVLESLGVAAIATARDGEEALALLDQDPGGVDVVLLDLDMPRMDGLELMRHLGERRVRPAVVVLGAADVRLIAAAESLAHSHFLYLLGSVAKPVKPASLRSVLTQMDPDRTSPHRDDGLPLTETELREGLEGDALQVVYQPKVAVADRKVVGAEALARWAHPERGMLGPRTFLPVAARLGLMEVITDKVFRSAMVQAGEWQMEGFGLSMAVNFAADDLNRLDLPEYIVNGAQSEGVDPTTVILEVTESRVMQDFRVPLEILARLRLRGVGLSIDDFGKAFSAVERIRHIPFTEMKVDRAFVYGASSDPAARSILESSITLGRSLGLTLVAEGVETGDDWALVERLGCDHVQGYFVSRPIQASEFADWYRRWRH